MESFVEQRCMTECIVPVIYFETDEDNHRFIASDLWEIYARTFIFELNYLKPFLPGETEEEKYHAFCRKMMTSEYREELYRTYPVLIQEMERKAKVTNYSIQEIRACFSSDLPSINAVFFHDNPCTTIRGLEFGKGDSHHNGRRVSIITLDNGEKLVYKPRSMRIDSKYRELLQWFSGKLKIDYDWYKVLDCGTYGWSEFVVANNCQTEKEVSNYYYRNGLLIFLAKLLGSTDLHYENLVANGEYPVIVDLETALSGGKAITEPALSGLEEMVSNSVLQSGLLPLYAWGKDGKGVNVSSLNGTGGQIIPIELPTVIQQDKADMRIEYRHLKTKEGKNLCLLKGKFAEPSLYIEEIVRGFRDAYTTAMQYSNEVSDLISNFAGASVRRVLRDTQSYAMILSLSWHPKYLVQGGAREQVLSKLDRTIPDKKSFRFWQLQEENKSLLLGDMPYFWYDPASTELFSDIGTQYQDYFREPVLDTIKRRLSILSAKDLQIQERLIRSSLQLGEKKKDRQRSNTVVEDTRTSRIYAAKKVANRLLAESVTAENGEIGWIQSTFAGDREQGYLTQPTNAYLYNGTSGILLFLFSLMDASKDLRCKHLAERLVLQLDETISQAYTYTNKHYQTGIYSGEASLAFACQLLYLKTYEKEWLERMQKSLIKMSSLFPADINFDLLSGNAGAIMAYLNAYELTDDDSFLKYAEDAGNLLVERAEKRNCGWCWPSTTVGIGLTGMAHGTAGIMLALTRLGHYSREERFYNAAYQALRYENAFFSAEKDDWMDLRFADRKNIIDEILMKKRKRDIYFETMNSPGWLNAGKLAWCHGKAGILLARECAKRYADRNINEVLSKEATKLIDRKFSYHNITEYNLCHGLSGIAAVKRYLGARNESAVRKIIDILHDDSVILEQVLSVQERQNYGLMSGITGIGYSLLASDNDLITLLTGDISFLTPFFLPKKDIL